MIPQKAGSRNTQKLEDLYYKYITIIRLYRPALPGDVLEELCRF